MSLGRLGSSQFLQGRPAARKMLKVSRCVSVDADSSDVNDRATFTKTMTEYFLSIFFTRGNCTIFFSYHNIPIHD